MVDGNLRLTYAQFGERCDRWSIALSRLGVGKGDRVAVGTVLARLENRDLAALRLVIRRDVAGSGLLDDVVLDPAHGGTDTGARGTGGVRERTSVRTEVS